MSSTSDPEKGAVCAVNPFAGGFRFQSAQPHLKRFVMFDHSNGKGRVFFHPAVAQELFGSAHDRDCESKGLLPDKEARAEFSTSSLVAYRQMVEEAFTSLQSLRATRHNEATAQKGSPLLFGSLVSPQKPRVPESIAIVDGENRMLNAQIAPQPRVASETLVCEEKPKVSAIRPSTEIVMDCNRHTIDGGSSNSNRSQICGLKRSEVAAASELMRENTEDLDALLSSDEDEDDDVQSTGHSPDESLGKEGSCGDDEDDEVEQYPCKKRRTSDHHEIEQLRTQVVGAHKNSEFPIERGKGQSSRRQKIKRTVKALRRMIPGGALLDTAFVLDKTITYVKTLRDRVNQLEAARLQSNFH